MQAIRSRLVQCGLSQPKAIVAYDLTTRLEKFIKTSQKDEQLLTNNNIDEQRSFINTTIKLLEKLCHDSVEKSWIRLLLVDSIINYFSPSVINDNFIDFLDQICEQSLTKINKIPPRRMVKSKTFMGKVSNGLSKISSMINIDYFTQSKQLYKKDITTEKNLQKSLPIDIPTKIVLQYGVYLRKKLQNYKFCIKTRQKYQNNEKIIIKNDSHLSQLRQYVWKVINLINHHTIIVKLYKKIAFMENQAKPLIVATFTMLCRDNLILYPYIVKLIEIQSQIIKQKYTKINSQKKQQREIKRMKLQALSKDFVFIQIENLLRELTPINQTIFYLFCGKLHYMYITFQVPKHYFLNTANTKLDEIHNILSEVKLIAEKQQKSKLYRTQMSIKLDNSVNKIVQKLDYSQSIATMRDIKSAQTKDSQESNELEENQKIKLTQRKKKVYSFYQERTQVI